MYVSVGDDAVSSITPSVDPMLLFDSVADCGELRCSGRVSLTLVGTTSSTSICSFSVVTSSSDAVVLIVFFLILNASARVVNQSTAT